ncbi:hypothetical protein QEJ31_08095 [Pigmentibacter sp. JX0631]|uniref:hypothetical protein n=1 Tax=Pigmentibacter sp. JX0631 TaxID=2976982 RepID=UPI0024689AFC|nr:hypothetical protein [Pigmentibacter sp. JX0631]WGL58501.1 hypothetical protein QEJ31_08095 [Pigmentibacter sp. JX0631]
MAIKLKQSNQFQDQNGKWFKLHDAAELLSVSEITLRRKIKAGKIISELRDGKYFVYLNELIYKEKKQEINNIEKCLLDKEEEIKNLKTQLLDQKILINALEEKIKQYNKNFS